MERFTEKDLKGFFAEKEGIMFIFHDYERFSEYERTGIITTDYMNAVRAYEKSIEWFHLDKTLADNKYFFVTIHRKRDLLDAGFKEAVLVEYSPEIGPFDKHQNDEYELRSVTIVRNLPCLGYVLIPHEGSGTVKEKHESWERDETGGVRRL